MGTKYTSVSVSGYNSSPPADDGSQSASNQIKWSTIKSKLPDPIKTAVEAINSGLATAFDYSARSITTSDSALSTDHMRTIEIAPTVSSVVTVTLSDAATMGASYVVGLCNRSNFTALVTRATVSDVIDNTATAVSLLPLQTVGYKVNALTNGYLTTHRGTVSNVSGSSGGLVLIQRQTPSGVATCDFTTGISSTYDEYVVTFTDVRPATNGVNLWYRISEDGGSTFKSTGYYGGYSLVGDVTAGAFTSQSNQAQALIAVSVGNTAARPLSGELRFWSPSSTTTAKKCIASTIYGDGTTDEARFQQTGILYTPTPAAMNAIRFMFSSGNITSGSIALYGVSKA